MLANRGVSSFPAADEDYFAAMDNGAKLNAEEVKGRDMWLVWSGGNDRFWDNLIKDSFGTFDLLKTISSAPGLPYSRDTRFKYFGVINEPCFDKPTQPDPKRFGLWLDKRRADCAPDPFANARKYPGVQMGARGTDGLPVGSYYGEPTGIVGLRLFTNPAFDAEARRKWDPNRYYNDPEYYQNKDLVRPYRVGMSCAFCHIGPSPIKPPKDPENPKWENLNGTVGAQYFWFDRVFVWNGDTVELHLPAAAHLQAGHARHLAGLVRQHRQSAHHERDLCGHAAADAGASGRPRAAEGRPARQQAVQRLHVVGAADPALRQARRVHAARAQGRLRLGRRAGRAQSRLPQYRPVRRGMADALPAVRQRQADEPDQDRRRQEATPSTGRRPSSRRSTWPSTCWPPASPTGSRRCRRPSATSTSPPMPQRSSAARTCSPRIARAAIPASITCRGRSSAWRGREAERCNGPNYLDCWSKYWSLDQDGRLQDTHEGDRPLARLPQGQLSLDRVPRAGDAAADQRLQPPRPQRAARQHLGQLLVGELQGPALGRRDLGDRSDQRFGSQVHHAGRRARLYAAAVADQPVVDGALSAQQLGRRVLARSLDRDAHEAVQDRHRADAVAGQAQA